jgi:hypothetical protein
MPAKPVKEWFREMTWLSQAAKRGRSAGEPDDAEPTAIGGSNE